MSFDSEFNFSNAVAYINNQIAVETSRVNDAQLELTAISAIPSHDALTQARINQLNSMINLRNDRKSKWQSILAQINSMATLNAGKKTTLYNMWLIVQPLGEGKNMYMARFLYNYDKMVTSGAPVLADLTLSADQKNALCKIILTQNAPTSDANKILTRL